MKRILSYVACLISIIYQSANAQELSKLNLPATPAFSILDYEPSSVMRPTNLKSLSSDILNSFDKDGKLIMNLGLEVSPYWLASHARLRMQNVINPTPYQAFLQSLSISAATVKDSQTGSKKIGFGFRFKILNGKPGNEAELISSFHELQSEATLVAVINSLKVSISVMANPTKKSVIKDIRDKLEQAKLPHPIINDFVTDAIRISDNYSDSKEDIQKMIEELIILKIEEYKEIQSHSSELLYERKGFFLEFAGAVGTNSINKNAIGKIGAWGNATYAFTSDDLLTFTTRVMSHFNDTLMTNFDAGIGYLKKTNHFNLSMEAMFRMYQAKIKVVENNIPFEKVKKENTYRVAVQGTYLINPDISINLSFGKDFDSPFITGNSFFSIMGVNYTIFSRMPTSH